MEVSQVLGFGTVVMHKPVNDGGERMFGIAQGV